MIKQAIEEGMAFQIQEHMGRIVEGEERKNRVALMTARGYAIELLMRTQSQEATEHAKLVRDVADDHVYSEVSTPILETAVRYCRALVQCAFCADVLERE